MRRVVALVLCAVVWLVLPSGAATGFEPAGSTAAKKADEQVRSVPLIVAHYDSGLQPANVPSGYQEKCGAQVYYRWPEIHGYQAQHIIYTRLGSKEYHELTPPYGDADPNGPSLGGDFALPAGMHQYKGAAFYSVTNGPPGVYEDCRDEADTFRATHSAAEVTYVRSEACTDAQDKLDTASDKVKAAKRAVHNATNDADKAKAKAKLKKAKKKLKKAKALVGDNC